MKSTFKKFGLALITSLLLMAASVPVASAQFTSDKEHTILSGAQEGSHLFSAGSGFGAISCSTATFAGTAVNKVEESQVIDPTYSGCKDSLGRTVHIHDGALSLRFTDDGSVHVTGTLTETITGANGVVVCTVSIHPQTLPAGTIAYDNLGGTSGVRATINATSVASTVEGGFFNCGTSTTSATAGTYKGTTVMTGKNTSGAAASISVD